jgi:hypothetical protein
MNAPPRGASLTAFGGTICAQEFAPARGAGRPGSPDPSRQPTSTTVYLAGLLTSGRRDAFASLLLAVPSRPPLGRPMACTAFVPSYSGGAVPEFHRIPYSPAGNAPTSTNDRRCFYSRPTGRVKTGNSPRRRRGGDAAAAAGPVRSVASGPSVPTKRERPTSPPPRMKNAGMRNA